MYFILFFFLFVAVSLHLVVLNASAVNIQNYVVLESVEAYLICVCVAFL